MYNNISTKTKQKHITDKQANKNNIIKRKQTSKNKNTKYINNKTT